MSPRRNRAFTKEAEALALAVHELLRRVRFDDVQTVCACGLTRTECHVLEVVALDGPLGVSEVAARIHLNKSTASRVVQSLLEKKLVRRAASDRDGRAVAVSVTEKGRTTWRAIVEESAAAYAPVIEGWSPAERKVIATLLRRIADHAVGARKLKIEN